MLNKNILWKMFKIIGVFKYVILMPAMLHGQSLQKQCAKDCYIEFIDSIGGPKINGTKAVYHYYQIPWDKITQVNDSVYTIKHPDFTDGCKEKNFWYTDTANIIADAEQGDRYHIAIAMMYLSRVPQKIFVVPVFETH